MKLLFARARALASSRSYDLSLVILGANNTVKKRLDIAAKTLANWLNGSIFGTGTHSHTRAPGRVGWGGGGGAKETISAK